MHWFKRLVGAKPSHDEFAEIAKKALKDFGVLGNFVFNPSDFSVSIKTADGTVDRCYFLENAYADYCRVPGNVRGQVLTSYFSPPQEIPKTLDEAAAHILPRVQSRAFYAEIPLRLSTGEWPTKPDHEEDYQFPFSGIATHLASGFVYDSPHSVTQINVPTCRNWNVNAEQLQKLAVENLQALTTRGLRSPSPGLYVSDYGDTHDASRLLLRERLAECRVKGRCIALVPSRELLMVSGEDDYKAHAAMLKVAETLLKHPRALPMLPLVWENGAWTEMPIPDDHPERNRFTFLRAVGLASIYNTQKQLLDKLFAAQEKDVFVASYMATQQERTGQVTTRAAWTQGVATLLPEVDEITLVQPSDPKAKVICTVPWAVARDVLGELMQPMDTYPQRYRVDSPPSEAQLTELKKYETV